jgi:hypothetical protein
MANYKETVIDGVVSEYQRSNKVIIVNELDQTPEITFMEQILMSLPDGRKIVTGHAKCSDLMGDPTELFPLLNPQDDTVIGEARYVDTYVILYSLYRHVANKRDNPPILVDEEPI